METLNELAGTKLARGLADQNQLHVLLLKLDATESGSGSQIVKGLRAIFRS